MGWCCDLLPCSQEYKGIGLVWSGNYSWTSLQLLQYAVAHSISRRLFRSLFPIRTTLCSYSISCRSHYKLLFIEQCNFVVKTVRTLNKLRPSKSCLVRMFIHAGSRNYMRKQQRPPSGQAIVERFKEKWMYGLSAKKWLLWRGGHCGQKCSLIQIQRDLAILLM